MSHFTPGAFAGYRNPYFMRRRYYYYEMEWRLVIGGCSGIDQFPICVLLLNSLHCQLLSSFALCDDEMEIPSAVHVHAIENTSSLESLFKWDVWPSGRIGIRVRTTAHIGYVVVHFFLVGRESCSFVGEKAGSSLSPTGNGNLSPSFVGNDRIASCLQFCLAEAEEDSSVL